MLHALDTHTLCPADGMSGYVCVCLCAWALFVYAHARAGVRVRFILLVASNINTTEHLEPTPPTLGAVVSDVLLAHWHTMSDTDAPACPAFLAEWWRQPLLCRAGAREWMAGWRGRLLLRMLALAALGV